MSQEAESKRIFWDHAEWDQFATLLHEAAPQAGYLHSRDLASLTMREMNNAGQKMARARSFASVDVARDKLLDAYARLRAGRPDADGAPCAAEAAPDAFVRWSELEWEQFAAMLHAARPEADYLHSPDLAAMTIRELKEAGARMARPRTKFASISMSRPKLLDAYARLRERLPEPAAGHESQVRRAPPPAEPPSPLKLDAEGRPVAGAPAARVPEPVKSEPCGTLAWGRAEWLAIATELDRMYPGSNYPQREHLAGLTSEDVAFAQRVLPLDRQIRHLKVVSFSTLLPQLRQAFRDLAEQRRLRAGRDEAGYHAREALARASAVPAQAAPTPAAAPAASAPASAAQVNPYEAAFAPLVGHVLGMLVERLTPVIAGLIEQALNAPPAPAAAPAVPVAAPACAGAPTPEDAPAPARPARPTVLRVGIVGNRTTYAADLGREFPGIEFTCIDNKRRIDSIRNCDHVICLTKFMGHDIRNLVERAVGPQRYVPVNGSLSDMRRVITGLLNGAAIHPARASVLAH